MELEFSGEIWEWRGPAPFHFVTVPPDESDQIAAVAGGLTYGWGAVPVSARIGSTDFTTSLFPRDDSYLLPVKAAVRKAERIELGDTIDVSLHLELDRKPRQR